MNNDGCECVICLDNIINNNNNCDTCNNCVCNNCYFKMIDRTYEQLGDISYICPFCKTENFKTWKAINYEVIVDYFTANEYKQKKELKKFRDIIFNKDEEITILKAIIKNNDEEIKKSKELIETQANIINNIKLNLPKSLITAKKLIYQEFYKITNRNLKNSETTITPQERMKRISVLWHEYKKSFEVKGELEVN